MKIWKKLSLLILFLFFFNCGNTFNQLSGEKEDDGETENLLLLGALLSSSGCNGLWTVNVFTGDYTCTGAYLASSGTYVDVYVQVGLEDTQSYFGVSKYSYSDIVSTFDSIIYPKVTDAAGSVTDINQDKKITLLVMDINNARNYSGSGGYVAGYVDPINYLLDLPEYGYRSNQREMLVIDGIYLSAARTKASKESKPDVLYSTIAHELQHLIRFPYELKRSNITSPIDPLTLPSTITFDDTWINEGTSEVISDIAGYGPQSDRIKCFRGDPSNTNSSCTNGFIAKSMISWSSNILNYSYAYAFMNYLYYNSGTSTTTRNSFLKSTTTGSSTRGSSITGLMSVFKNASNYSSTLLSSDTSTMFKRLFALFLAQTLKYSSSSTAYYGSTTGSSMSSLYSTYSYPSNLTSLMNLPTYLPTVTGSSFELYPTVSYRVSGTSSGPSNSNAVVVQSTGSEYVIFNGSTSSSSYITTSASVKSNQQSESNLPGFDMKAVFSYPEQKDFCTHQYFIERFLHKNNNILHY